MYICFHIFSGETEQIAKYVLVDDDGTKKTSEDAESEQDDMQVIKVIQKRTRVGRNPKPTKQFTIDEPETKRRKVKKDNDPTNKTQEKAVAETTSIQYPFSPPSLPGTPDSRTRRVSGSGASSRMPGQFISLSNLSNVPNVNVNQMQPGSLLFVTSGAGGSVTGEKVDGSGVIHVYLVSDQGGLQSAGGITPNPCGTITPTPPSSIINSPLVTITPTPPSSIINSPVATITPTPPSSIINSPVATITPAPPSSIINSPLATNTSIPSGIMSATPVTGLKSSPPANQIAGESPNVNRNMMPSSTTSVASTSGYVMPSGGTPNSPRLKSILKTPPKATQNMQSILTNLPAIPLNQSMNDSSNAIVIDARDIIFDTDEQNTSIQETGQDDSDGDYLIIDPSSGSVVCSNSSTSIAVSDTDSTPSHIYLVSEDANLLAQQTPVSTVISGYNLTNPSVPNMSQQQQQQQQFIMPQHYSPELQKLPVPPPKTEPLTAVHSLPLQTPRTSIVINTEKK